jgi:hypothetical protein
MKIDVAIKLEVRNVPSLKRTIIQSKSMSEL